MQTIIKTDSSSLKMMPEYLLEKKRNRLFQKCLKLDLVKNPKIKLYGKEATMHRSVGFFSDESEGYKYSGQLAVSQPLPDFLTKLLTKVNEEFGTDFNGILVKL